MTTKPGTPRGTSLIELIVAMTIMGVLISFSVPSFTRAVEQSKADVAGANLRAVWSAQRLYRLDNPAYAPDLATLISAGLLDSNFPATSASSTPPYAIAIGLADSQTFTVTATRSDGTWAGFFSINQTGIIDPTLKLTKAGEVSISPGFL